MKVLVTGSSGWLGRHLIPMLSENNIEAIGLDVAPGAFTHIIASVANREAIADAFKRHQFDGVIHAGALHKPDIARFPQQAFVDVNVTGTLNLLEAASARPGTVFVFTSTTSLMISQQIRAEKSANAVWLDESAGPLEPRNIYGATKLAGEALCRQHQITNSDMHVVVLRTSRFFPEDDDTISIPTGPNLKATELLYRRATVQDMARAHITALKNAGKVGFGLYIVSAPTPFTRQDCADLKADAASVIDRYFPGVDKLFDKNGWTLPRSIGRVYDGTKIERDLGFRYETSFESVLDALRKGNPLPIAHDSSYISPITQTS